MQFEIDTVYVAFDAAPRPAADEITSHRCCECDRVRDDLARFRARDVPDDVLSYHGDSIPLLTPKAFRYFLPRYIQFTCDHPGENATEILLFNLSPEVPSSEFWSGRCDDFSDPERESILRYLAYRKTWRDAYLDAGEIERAIRFWLHHEL